MPPDPGKPCQADVLKILALGSEMQKSITELFHPAETLIHPLNEDVKLVPPMSFAKNIGAINEVENTTFCTDDTNLCEGSIDSKVLPGSACIEHCASAEDIGNDLLSKETGGVAKLTPKVTSGFPVIPFLSCDDSYSASFSAN